jgi:adenylate cyclase
MMTLRHKIVSLTFGVLVLFAIAACASIILQNRIRDRFNAVIQYHMPLNAEIATLDVLTDEYELVLLRWTADQPNAGADATTQWEQHEADRTEDALQLTAAVAKIDGLVEAALKNSAESVEDRIAMASLRGRFSYLRRALPEFIEIGRRFSDQIREGQRINPWRVSTEFTPYRKLFGDDLHAIRNELAELSETVAASAARLHQQHIILELAMLGLASLVGIGMSLAVSSRMMSGLQRLIERTRQMQEGQPYELLPVTSSDEIGVLTIAFNRMAEDLKTQEHIKETFGKYVDPRIVSTLIAPAGSDALAERQIASVFFSDIKSFSGLSEVLTAPTLVKLLNTYFSEMASVIHARNGFVDKYIGDGLMAFWTAPFSPGETHAADACIAALMQQDAVHKLRERLSDVLGLRRDLPEFAVRMGIASGDLVVGTIGSPDARSFTVIGDTVNLASRLEGANKFYGTSILINEDTWRLAQREIEVRELDLITVLGKIEPVHVYEVMGLAGTLCPAKEELCGLFAHGLTAYRERDWDRAEQQFAKCLDVVPNDQPALVFHERVALLRKETLPANWDGVWHLSEK